jgi:hypothetical protein
VVQSIQEFAQDILRRLTIVKQAEETFEQNIKGDIVTEALQSVEKKIASDSSWKQKWDSNMFTALKQLERDEAPSVVDTTNLLFEDYLNEKTKTIEIEVDKSRPMDGAARGLFDIVLKNTVSV